MPTPYGPRGGMAFGPDELRVLRAALAAALRPAPGCSHVTPSEGGPGAAPPSPSRVAEVREYAALAAAVEEVLQEGDRLRSFQLADLARYRAALPGSAAGYLELLSDALATGHLPRPEDLDALRALPALAAGGAEADRRGALLRRCERLAEQAVRARLLLFAAPAPAPRPDVAAAAASRSPRPTPSASPPLPRRAPAEGAVNARPPCA